MKNVFFSIFASFFLLTACEKKTNESQNMENQPVDSVKQDTVARVPEMQLTATAAMLAKSWKAYELETPTAKLSSDLVDIKFNFKKNGDFEYTEDGKKERGSWKVNNEGTMVMLEHSDAKKTDYSITELKEDKMILTGKVHGMYRTYKLAPN